MKFSHPVRSFFIAVTLILGAGCQTAEPTKPAAASTTTAVVEHYPPPTDPTDSSAALAPAPPVEPTIIENGDKSTLIYTCRNVRSEVLKELLANFISPEGSLQASRTTNVILISDTKDAIPQLLKTIRELDHPISQLLVEARVVEVTLDNDLEYEIDNIFSRPTGGGTGFTQSGETKLTTPGSNPNTGMGGLITVRPWATDTRRLDSYIRILITKGKAKILSSPNLVVSAGNEASIITGEEVPIVSTQNSGGTLSYSTTFKQIGIKLIVTPLQITNDTALLDVSPEVSTVTGYTAPGTTGVSNPIVALRNCKTTLELKDGEILTIGGLLRNEDRKVTRKVPLLGDIPVFGLLFQSIRDQQVKTQLVFFLRVNILKPGQPRTIRIHTPSSGLDLLDRHLEPDAPATKEKP